MRSGLFYQAQFSRTFGLSVAASLMQYTQLSAVLLNQTRFFSAATHWCYLLREVQLSSRVLSTLDARLISSRRNCSTRNHFVGPIHDGYYSRTLVEGVLRGNEAIARKTLEDNSLLLLKSETAIDFSGRTFTGTAFQAALCTSDVEMCEIMKKHFSYLPNGLEIMRQQFDEIFPQEGGGLDAHLKKQACNMFDFTAINAVIEAASPEDVAAALANEDNGSTLCRELNNFRLAFTQHSHSEKVFNPNHLLRAFELYDTRWERVAPTDPDYPKRALFWRKILSFVQRGFLPASDAQAFSYGLYDIVVNKHPCPRSFNFRYDPSSSFYLNSKSEFGFDEAALSATGRGAPHCLLRGGSRKIYKTYVEQKHSIFRTYDACKKNVCSPASP